MANRSHVPKFGNWDADEDQYTACFETARREKSGSTMTMVNPNDPEQNPEALNFNMESGGGSGGSISCNSNGSSGGSSHRRNLSRRRSRGSHGSFTPESVSERSNYSDLSGLHRRENKKSVSRGGGHPGSFSSSSYQRRGNGSHSSRDFENQKAGTAIPKFGEWDEKDPKSGEDFTVFFSNLKEEKQTESHLLPNAPPQHVNVNAHKQRGRPAPKGSKYCCFFK